MFVNNELDYSKINSFENCGIWLEPMNSEVEFPMGFIYVRCILPVDNNLMQIEKTYVKIFAE